MPLYLMTPLKVFVATEATLNDVHQRTIHQWLHQRRYGWLVFHRVHRRVFVTGTTLRAQSRPARSRKALFQQPPAGAMWFKEWLEREASVIGIKRQALYMRIKRGQHPKPNLFFGGRQRAEYVIL